jgi:hypothetical protein
MTAQIGQFSRVLGSACSRLRVCAVCDSLLSAITKSPRRSSLRAQKTEGEPVAYDSHQHPIV